MQMFEVGFLVLLVVFGVSNYLHYLMTKELTTKIMAKNYGELVQAEILKKSVEVKPGLDVKVKQTDNEPDSVDVLNQYL